MTAEILFTITDGLIFKGITPIAAFELRRLLSDPESHSDIPDTIKKLRQSRRPAALSYNITVSEGISVCVRHREHVLTISQLESASSYGYFIQTNRIHYLNEHGQHRLKSAIKSPSPATIIRLIHELRLEGRLDGAPKDIINQLISSGEKRHTGKALFVRQLYPYQVTGVDWLTFCSENGIGTILADDMGLGKTAQVIALICNTLEKKPDSRVLVVVPNPLLENWRREFMFFAPSIVPYIHYGIGRSGLSYDLAGHSVVITPYTTMTQDISMLTELDFELALFDEASMLKNPRSARTRAACRLKIAIKVAMSGTPVENSLTDAWSLSELVFPGYLGGAKEFNQRYTDKDIGAVLDQNLEELECSLRQITLRRMKKDVLDQLPAKRDIHIPVTMAEKEQVEHDRIIFEMKAEADNGSCNILQMINKLQQFTAHPALLDSTADTSVQGLISASGKFELLIGYLDKIRDSGEKVLIFATFHKTIDLIASAIKTRYGLSAGLIDGRTPNAERQELIDAFSASEGFDVLILHPRTAGMGLNITAASHVIHYSRQWNPALEQQATARAWRNGQRKTVSVYYLFYVDTIEETVDERLRLKQELSDRVVSVTDDKESDKQLMLNYLEKERI
ncbi:DEAD/DEAH box helicase [Neptunomonas sp.]|uniref:DEAD/DEAH box helicase n=1 Tax=Neptunomonas sp. TaxID=1971898 RepID=UPI0035633CE7